jgi:hypothetical protein
MNTVLMLWRQGPVSRGLEKLGTGPTSFLCRTVVAARGNRNGDEIRYRDRNGQSRQTPQR